MIIISNNKINNELGKLRRSSIVMTFGPGSIVDFRAEGAPISAIVAGLEEWDQSFPSPGLLNKQVVFEQRLERRMGVKGFRLPPVVDENNQSKNKNPDMRSLVAVRFPIWLQCPKCNLIAKAYQWASEPAKAPKYCPSCSAKSPGQQKVYVIPVRFVMACENGHLDEFPWHSWVDHKPGCKLNRGFLRLESKKPGLSGMILICPECQSSKSMDGIFNSQNWKGWRCRGQRPWLRNAEEECDLQPRILQRGASNLYFPLQASALSIPPWSDKLQESLGGYWHDIVETNPEDRAGFIRILARNTLKPVLEDLGLSSDELAEQIDKRVNRYNDDSILNIRQEEYRQLVSGECAGYGNQREFETRNVTVPDNLKSYFNKIVRVVRLREVMCIKGFTRINPPSGDENDQKITQISKRKMDWLPAIEVRGEGIFLEFNSKQLQKWEIQEEVQKRANNIQETWAKEWRGRYGDGEPSPTITSRYLLVHTWAHALMRQLTLECGYSSASLRERLYISEDENAMAGLLIYTATSDSDGTLGGLQRQGEAEKISRTVKAAVKAMEWCSSDPLCIQGMIAAPDNYSLAACHACCLAPETSCEEFNRFLDRAMIVGLPDSEETGYFSSILQED